MRHINERRRLVEDEGRIHAVKRGHRGKLHYENYPWLKDVFRFFLNITFTSSLGAKNALDIKVEELKFVFTDLPAGFDGMRILFISDLHIEGQEGLSEKIIGIAEKSDYDICILGGDYSFTRKGNIDLACSRMKDIVKILRSRSRVFGVLGNHDRYVMARTLTDYGVEMLLNDNVRIEKGDDEIYLAGMDDSHYYGAHDLETADSGISDGAFKIMVCHSPEQYVHASNAGYSLFLAGHTHGGQVCLPGGFIIVEGATVPLKMLKGKWQYHGMSGYTSRGVGTSSIPVRFFCPPEMTFITLKKSDGLELSADGNK